MKKVLLILSLAIATALISPSFKAGERNHIKVDDELQPYYVEFVRIVEENDLEVDWGKFDGIALVPLYDGVQGYWSEKTGGVLINYFYKFPPFIKLTNKEKDDYILLTLAHEIGHSQGWEHTNPDNMDLMNPTTEYNLLVIRGMGAEQYIVNTFKARAEKNK